MYFAADGSRRVYGDEEDEEEDDIYSLHSIPESIKGVIEKM